MEHCHLRVCSTIVYNDLVETTAVQTHQTGHLLTIGLEGITDGHLIQNLLRKTKRKTKQKSDKTPLSENILCQSRYPEIMLRFFLAQFFYTPYRVRVHFALFHIFFLFFFSTISSKCCSKHFHSIKENKFNPTVVAI